jgi:CRP-like cAMP-binding protein
MLQNVYLFKTFTPDELKSIASIVETKNVMTGESIFIKGETAKALYFIKSGGVKIEHSSKEGDSIQVASLGAGSHFGEMAFVDNAPRSATASGSETGEVLVIPYEKLEVLLQKNAAMAAKFYRALAHFLSGRLRVTTSDLSFAKEKNHAHF